MIYRVNKIEDLRALETELTTEAVVVIDKVLPYNCSGVMFKTTKGWSKVFLDSTQLNTDATINGSLTVLEDLTVTGEIISDSLNPVVYNWNDTNNNDSIPTDVDVIVIDVTTSNVNLYLPYPSTIGKSFIIVATGPLLSSNKVYLTASFGALVNGDIGGIEINVNDMKRAVGVGDG